MKITSDSFLDELVLSWLRKEDNVIKKGLPSWQNLVTALTAIGQTGIAETIKKEKSL